MADGSAVESAGDDVEFIEKCVKAMLYGFYRAFE